MSAPELQVTGELAGAMFNGIDVGRALGRDVLITWGPRQTRPLAAVRTELAYDLAGTGRFCAILDGEHPTLLEERPPGTPLIERAPLTEPDARALLTSIATIVAAAHARGIVLHGIHPRLTFLDGARVALAPRALRFLLGMPPMRGGLCLDEIYLPLEVWRGGPVGPAADVFALCALGRFLVTGEHPFAGPTFDHGILARGAPPPLGTPLGAVLARGLAIDPRERPSIAQLQQALGA